VRVRKCRLNSSDDYIDRIKEFDSEKVGLIRHWTESVKDPRTRREVF
jgi:hypothetical protein